jgi:hypothetical protein
LCFVERRNAVLLSSNIQTRGYQAVVIGQGEGFADSTRGIPDPMERMLKIQAELRFPWQLPSLSLTLGIFLFQEAGIS